MQHSLLLAIPLPPISCLVIQMDGEESSGVKPRDGIPRGSHRTDRRGHLGPFFKNHRLLRLRGPRRRPGAFTLLELLVVISILAVLVALIVPSVRGVLDSARVAKSTANLKALGQGVSLYVAENNGLLPSPGGNPAEGINPWYLDIYSLVYQNPPPPAFFVPWDTGTNLRGTIFHCPFVEKSGEGTPVRSYGYNTFLKDGVDAPSAPAPRIKLSKLKQPSKTMMFATSRNSSSVGWGPPPLNNLASSKFSTRAGGKVLLIFADGHAENRASTNIPASNQDIFWKGYE